MAPVEGARPEIALAPDDAAHELHRQIVVCRIFLDQPVHVVAAAIDDSQRAGARHQRNRLEQQVVSWAPVRRTSLPKSHRDRRRRPLSPRGRTVSAARRPSRGSAIAKSPDADRSDE